MRLIAGKKERCPVNVRRGLLLRERMDRANWEKETKCWEACSASMNRRCGKTSSLRIHWLCWRCHWNTGHIPPNWLFLQCKSHAYCTHTHLSYRSLSSRYQTEPCQYWLACLATSYTPYLGVWHTIFADIWRVLVYDHLKEVCIDSSGSYHELRSRSSF